MGGIYLAVLSCTLLCTAPLYGACIKPVSHFAVDNFLKDPRVLLEAYPHGDARLEGAIRGYAAMSEDVLNAIRQIISLANHDQRNAIGKGLAFASIDCEPKSPDVSRKIEAAIRRSNDPDVLRSYNLTVTVNPINPPLRSPDKPHSGPVPAIGVDMTHPVGRKGLSLNNQFRPFLLIDKLK